MIKTGLIASLLILLAGFSAFLINLNVEPENTFGQVGLACNIATSSTIDLEQKEQIVVATSTTRAASCTSIIISTQASAVQLSFHDNFIPTATVGITQPGSTTVAYPAELYGCGQVSVFGQADSETLNVAVCR